MPERLSPIAQRGWAHPPGWKPTKRQRPVGAWPRAAFLLTTLARPCAGEPLRFGACALLPSLLPGQQPVDVRLVYADDCPPDEQELIVEVAAARGLPPPLSRSRLVELLFKRCYKHGLPLVGFGLPPQLGRLAAGWRPARGGGFSLILATLPCPPGRRKPAERRRRPLLPNGEIENGDRPGITAKPLDGQRAVIQFQGRGRPDPQDLAPDGEAGRPRDKYVFPGRFVDLATLASVQAAGKRLPTLAAAAAALGTPTPQPAASSGELTAGQIEAALSELDALAALYLRLLDCHHQTPGCGRVTPDQVYSAASYAEGIFETVGLELPLSHSDLPGYVHAYGMGAFFGGDCGVALRHVDAPVAYLDITGHYPASAHLAGSFELLRATKLELVEEDPAKLQRFLASLTLSRLQTEPELWKRLGRTVCLIRAQGDVLPHRVPNGNSLLLKTAPLWSLEPLPYMLADLAAGTLRTGLLPKIASAFSIRPVPRHRKRLRPLALPSGHLFDPSLEDLFLALAEERLRLKQRPDLSAAERERQAQLVKLIVNAACYGLLCQINVQATGGEMEVTNLDGSIRTVREDAVEEPGRWTHPLLAAGVTAAGRLLLQLCRLTVERAGATVCGWDTDSLFSTGLSPAQLAEAQEKLEALSPYNPVLKPDPAVPLLLALEDENFDPDSGLAIDLHLYATASKNYDLHTLDPAGTLTLRKTSEHGLGHLRTPGHPDRDDRAWIGDGRTHLLACRLHLPTQQPDWWVDPAISVITLNRPGELARQQTTQPAGRLLRPFSRLAVAHAVARYARDGHGNRRTPVAPFHDGFDPHHTNWHDLTTGQPLTLRYPEDGQLRETDLATTIPGRLLCETVGQALERNSRRPETKALDQDGNPCGRNTVGLLQPAPTEATRRLLIGKETRNLERAGITEDPAYTLYSNSDEEAWQATFLPVLRDLPALVSLVPAFGGLSGLAATIGVSRSALHEARRHGRASRGLHAKLVPALGAVCSDALRILDPTIDPPADLEQACRSYLQARDVRGPRLCEGEGCDVLLIGRQRRWCDNCRKAARMRQSRGPLAAKRRGV